MIFKVRSNPNRSEILCDVCMGWTSCTGILVGVWWKCFLAAIAAVVLGVFPFLCLRSGRAVAAWSLSKTSLGEGCMGKAAAAVEA